MKRKKQKRREKEEKVPPRFELGIWWYSLLCGLPQAEWCDQEGCLPTSANRWDPRRPSRCKTVQYVGSGQRLSSTSLPCIKLIKPILNPNSKIFFRRITVQNGFPTKRSGTQNMCFVMIFIHILKANDPNRFHFLLKVLLPSKFLTKSTCGLLKRLQKNQTDRY